MIIVLLVFKEMETVGWSNFDLMDEAGNIAFMAATTMSKILEMSGNNEGK